MASDFEKPRACPACGSPSFRPWRRGQIDHRSFGPDNIKITDKEYGRTWDLSRCENCGHAFADPLPTQKYISRLYSLIEDPLYQEESGGREKNFKPIIEFLGRLHPGRGILFDVGAATGILLNAAQKRGWAPDGIEPSSWAVQTAEKNYGLTLRRGDFETAALPGNHYTAVTMVDFIEHIPLPDLAILKTGKILAPEGTLCLVTPNLSSFAARAAGRRWWHFRPAHLHYFNPGSLRILLKRNGFTIIKTRKYSWTFSAHYLISRIPGSNFLLHHKKLSSFWRSIPVKLAFGDSLEVYARKMS